jgi:membrane-associated phospholipid phosphatase
VEILFESLRAIDTNASAWAEGLRWEPLTFVFVAASLWWVKWPLLVAVGACGDAKCRRKWPYAAAAGGLAVGVAALLVAVLKDIFDRARPPLQDASLDPIGIVPASASFPSSHAATAFAAAVAVGLVHPRLRRPLLAMAAVVALSRVYLGVHYLFDVVVGTLIGIGIGYAAALTVQAVGRAPTRLALRL